MNKKRNDKESMIYFPVENQAKLSLFIEYKAKKKFYTKMGGVEGWTETEKKAF